MLLLVVTYLRVNCIKLLHSFFFSEILIGYYSCILSNCSFYVETLNEFKPRENFYLDTME